MVEVTLVRENLMNEPGYAPYCGSVIPGHPNYYKCNSPRAVWDSRLNQFRCPKCNWVSEFPQDFIERYKAKWNK